MHLYYNTKTSRTGGDGGVDRTALMRCRKQRIEQPATTNPTSAVLRSRDHGNFRVIFCVFFLKFFRYGWASRRSACRVSFNSVRDRASASGLGKRHPLVTSCHSREFGSLPRRTSRESGTLVDTVTTCQQVCPGKTAPVVFCSESIHLVYIKVFIHVLYLPHELCCVTLATLGAHQIPLSFLLQGGSEGNVRCWCTYSDQQFAGLRRHHDKVCWTMWMWSSTNNK